MRRIFCLFIFALTFTSIGCPPGPTVIETPKKIDVKPVAEKPVPLDKPEHLKPRIEAALDQVRERDLRTDHAFWTVFHGILGMGLDNTMLTDPKTKKKTNAIDYICAGGEIRGLQFLPTPYGLDVATVSPERMDLQFVAQGHQDQFIAEMAQWGMAPTRKFKVGGKDFTFQDFINHSKMRTSINQKQELSWAIVIVGQYFGTDYSWTNRAGEKLHYNDVVRYEVDASIEEAACGGTHRLFGLTWAYHLHLKYGGKKDGVWKDVEAKIEHYKKLARSLQNPDGSCSTQHFKGKGDAQEIPLRISTSGHIVEWLALAMTDEELKAPWMQNAVNALSMMILDMSRHDVEGGALYHAAHGLHLYHERVFGTPAPYLALPPRK